jgi:hypothetical protein
VDEALAKIISINRSKEDKAVREKTLAEAWQVLTGPNLKRHALEDIMTRGGQKAFEINRRARPPRRQELSTIRRTVHELARHL